MAVTSSQSPVLDRDHPEILEEARWWINVQETRTRRNTDRTKLTSEVRVESTPQTLDALTSGMNYPVTAVPGSINAQSLSSMTSPPAASGVWHQNKI